MEIAHLGVEADTTGVVSATRDLDRFGDQAAQTEGQVRRLGRTSDRSFATTARGAQRLSNAFRGNGIRQASLQLSQVAQQASATGDFVRALAIQLPDLGLAFGTVGIAAGVLGGALLPLAADLAGFGDEADQSNESLDQFAEALSEAVDAAEFASTPIEELREQFGRFAADVQRTARLTAEVRLFEATSQFSAAAESIREGLEGTSAAAINYQRALDNLDVVTATLGERTIQNASAFDEAEASVESARQAMTRAAADIGLTSLEAVRLDQALQELASAEGMDAVAEAARDALKVIADMQSETSNLPPAVAEISKELNNVLQIAAQGVTAFDDIGGSIGNAADEASRLAAETINVIEALRLQDLDAFGGGGDFRFDLPQTIRPSSRSSRRATTARGSGGASEAERKRREMQREGERILDNLRTAQERYNDSVAQADRLLKAGILTQDGYNRQIDQLKIELEEIEFAEVYDGIERISSTLGDALLDADSFGDAMGNVMRRVASEILSSGIAEAIRAVFNVPNLGGGGSSGGFFGSILSSIFGGFRAEGGSVTSGRSYVVGERGPELFVPSGSGNIVPNGEFGASPNITINNIVEPGLEATTQTSPDGRTITTQVRRTVASDIAQGGEISRSIQRSFGIKPALGGR